MNSLVKPVQPLLEILKVFNNGKPFHRQAKGRPVAKPLSRARQVSICVLFFSGIATLDKRPATSAIGGLSEAMVVCV
jgi:hypothetical protein